MNFKKRLWYSFRLCTILSENKRVEYMRKKKIFYEIGENVTIMSRKVPLYSRLIRFHNNVTVGSNVAFVTHDAAHHVLNRYNAKKYQSGGAAPLCRN